MLESEFVIFCIILFRLGCQEMSKQNAMAITLFSLNQQRKSNRNGTVLLILAWITFADAKYVEKSFFFYLNKSLW